MSLKILSPFGPKMAKLSLPKPLVAKINQEVDKIITSSMLSKKYNYSKQLAGEVEQEIELPNLFVNKFLKKFFETNIKSFVKDVTGKTAKQVKLKNFWVVRQFANDYNPIHFHDGDISGVGYLKLPKNFSKSKKKYSTNGSIDFVHGSRMFLNKSILNHKPKVGDLLFFPNYLMHTAYPFSAEGERRSFSFNAEIDKSISKIFHG
ncbi:2OG-Fe(II) oxygenase family protein [Pelagibacteraceae bacterium]|nr:2OG-Fe(II) oxygenase family protein [Pelagibacteraceae bacterium]